MGMFKFGAALVLSGVMSVSAGASEFESGEPVVTVEAQRIFVPTGFDDNDNVQVVADGHLPNSCYSLVGGAFTVDPGTLTIVIEPRAKVSSGPCIEVLVPYSHIFNLGVLPEGEYTVITKDGQLQKTLKVAEASSSGPDNELYASIDNAYVMYDPALQRDVIMLEGTYTNTCMVWARTELIYNNPEVLEVLPVVRIEQRPDCQDLTFPFKGVRVEMPKLTEGRYLLHVRSMNGEAVNRVFATMGNVK